MGVCDSCNKPASTQQNSTNLIHDYNNQINIVPNINNNISFRCTYYVQDFNEVKIMNDTCSKIELGNFLILIFI